MIRKINYIIPRYDSTEPVFYTKKENIYRRRVYRDAINCCCMPGCNHGFDLEVHHIVPIKRDGTDDFTNFIVLCQNCHRRNRLHSRSDEHLLELMVYKFYIEKLELGFCSDEMSNEEFQLKCSKAIYDRNKKSSEGQDFGDSVARQEA